MNFPRYRVSMVSACGAQVKRARPRSLPVFLLILASALASVPLIAGARTAPPYFHYPGNIPPLADPLAGCNFNGECFHIMGSVVDVEYPGGPLFRVNVPENWQLASALAPVGSQGAIGLDLVNDTGVAQISLRFCLHDGLCAVGRYQSPRTYREAMLRRPGNPGRPSKREARAPARCSPLAARRWAGHLAYEFRCLDSGRSASQAGGARPARRLHVVILVPGRRGVMVAVYSAPLRLPVRMHALDRVFASLRLWETLQPANPALPALRFRVGDGADPDRGGSRLARARKLQFSGHDRAAVRLYAEIVRSNPRAVSAWRGLGQSQLALGRPRTAARAFARWVKLDARDPYSTIWLYTASLRAHARAAVPRQPLAPGTGIWPQPVMRYLIGQTGAQTMLDAALGAATGGQRTRRTCQAALFYAEKRLAAGRVRSAMSGFRLTGARRCASQRALHALAVSEYRRLYRTGYRERSGK